MLRAKDLHDQAVEELEATLIDIKKELFDLYNERKQTKKAENPHIFKEKKKDIARILTVLRQKQLANKS